MFMIRAFICFLVLQYLFIHFPMYSIRINYLILFSPFLGQFIQFSFNSLIFFIFILQLTISFCANQTFNLYMFISSSMTRDSMHNKKSFTWFQEIMQLFTPYTVYHAFCVERKAVQKKYVNIIHSQDFIFSLRHEY